MDVSDSQCGHKMSVYVLLTADKLGVSLYVVNTHPLRRDVFPADHPCDAHLYGVNRVCINDIRYTQVCLFLKTKLSVFNKI
jgi:hypothetical protein